MRETVGDGYRFEAVFLAVEDIIRPARCHKPDNSDEQQGRTQRLHVGNEFLKAHRLPALVYFFLYAGIEITELYLMSICGYRQLIFYLKIL